MGKRLRKVAIFALLLTTVSGCIPTGKRIDAQGFSGEDTIRKIVKNAAQWLLDALNRSGTRSFTYTIEELNYSGQNDIFKTAIQELKQNPVLFSDTQDLLKVIMQDPRFVEVHKNSPAEVVNLADIPGLRFFNAGMYRNNQVQMVRENIDTIKDDTRAVLYSVIHQYLRAFGFGEENSPASLAGITLPSTLSTLTNIKVIGYLTVVAIQLSDDYRESAPVGPGGPGGPSGPNWIVRWRNEQPANTTSTLAVNATLTSNVRVTGKLIFTFYQGNQAAQILIRGQSGGVQPYRGLNFVLMTTSNTSPLSPLIRYGATRYNQGMGSTLPCSGNFTLPALPFGTATFAVPFSLVAEGRTISLSINGNKVCTYEEGGILDSGITSFDFGYNSPYVTYEWLQAEDY